MLQKIKAVVINRNLVTTLKNTVDFLSKEPRVETIIFDQDSSYPPLLEYYKTQNVVYNNLNEGPYSAWKIENLTDNHYIIADSDCNYDGIPDDWLDKMLDCLNRSKYDKVGFSLKIDDLPNNTIGEQVRNHESRFWQSRCEFGWIADLDTTFSMYRARTGFQYQAVRLFEPYTIKHIPWYLEDDISEEWKYYLKNSNSFSTWGTRLKDIHKL